MRSFSEDQFFGTGSVCKGVPDGQPVSTLTVCALGQSSTGVFAVHVLALHSSSALRLPGPWSPRNTVLLRDVDDCFVVAHLLAIPGPLVPVARAVRVTTELPELSHDERSIRSCMHLLDHVFESVGSLLLISSLVRSHIWMEVVHDVFVVSCLLQLLVKVDGTLGIVRVALSTGDDEDGVWCRVPHSFDHVGHAFVLGVAV